MVVEVVVVVVVVVGIIAVRDGGDLVSGGGWCRRGRVVSVVVDHGVCVCFNTILCVLHDGVCQYV